MPSATFTKPDQFIEDLHHGVHNFSTHQLRVALTNQAPNVATMAVLADVTQVAYTNLQNNPTSRDVTVVSSGQTGGDYLLVLQDMTLTALGGDVGPFQWVWIYNDTPTLPADPLVGYLAYPDAVTLHDGEPFILDFSAVNGIIQAT